MQKDIIKYNLQLIEYRRTVNLREYLCECHMVLNSCMYESFMDYFISLVSMGDEFVVTHDKLKQYGVFKNNVNNTAKIKELLVSKYNMTENIDFKAVKQVNDKVGRKNNIYMLTPTAFKLCLLGTSYKDCEIYKRYYIFLESLIVYYSQYQELVKKEDDKKILDLSNEIKQVMFLSEKNIRNTEKLMHTTDIIKMQNERLEKKMDDVREIAFEVSGRYVPVPKKSQDSEYLVLLQDIEDVRSYYFTKGSKGHVNNVCKVRNNMIEILRVYSPNPKQLTNDLKYRIQDYNRSEYERIINTLVEQGDDMDTIIDLWNSEGSSYMITWSNNCIYLGDEIEISDDNNILVSLIESAHNSRYSKVLSITAQ